MDRHKPILEAIEKQDIEIARQLARRHASILKARQNGLGDEDFSAVIQTD